MTSGYVALSFICVTAAMPQLRSGHLKRLLIAGKERISEAPDVPTTAQVGMPDIDSVSGTFGAFAPARTPQANVLPLNREIVKVIETPEVRERFPSQQSTPVMSTPPEFAELIKSQRPKWAKAANVRSKSERIGQTRDNSPPCKSGFFRLCITPP